MKLSIKKDRMDHNLYCFTTCCRFWTCAMDGWDGPWITSHTRTRGLGQFSNTFRNTPHNNEKRLPLEKV